MAWKLPFPMWTQNTPARLNLNAEGIDEDGAPIPSVEWYGRVWYSEKSKTTKDKEGHDVVIQGSLVVVGDVAPALPMISDGVAEIAGRRYRVFRAERPRNPDGSIHHTTLELM